MAQGKYGELMEFLEVRVGDSLRTVFSYEFDDWSTLYIRDDVATGELRERVGRLVKRMREHESMADDRLYRGLGETQAMVELHSEGILINIKQSERSGVALSFDRDAVSDIPSFIDGCLAKL